MRSSSVLSKQRVVTVSSGARGQTSAHHDGGGFGCEAKGVLLELLSTRPVIGGLSPPWSAAGSCV